MIKLKIYMRITSKIYIILYLWIDIKLDEKDEMTIYIIILFIIN